MCASTNAQEHLIAAIVECHNVPVAFFCGLNEISGGFSFVVGADIYGRLRQQTNICPLRFRLSLNNARVSNDRGRLLKIKAWLFLLKGRLSSNNLKVIEK